MSTIGSQHSFNLSEHTGSRLSFEKAEPIEMQRVAKPPDQAQEPVTETVARDIPSPKKSGSKFTSISSKGFSAGKSIAFAPLMLLIDSVREIAQIKSARSDTKKNIKNCEKMVKTLCKELESSGRGQEASDLMGSFFTAEHAVRSGKDYEAEFDTLKSKFNEKLPDNDDNNARRKKFNEKIGQLKESIVLLDKRLKNQGSDDVDEIELYGTAIVGALSLPSLPLTIAVGLGVFGVMSVIDGIQAQLGNGKAMIPGGLHDAKSRMRRDESVL